jgi:hypothetical protein
MLASTLDPERIYAAIVWSHNEKEYLANGDFRIRKFYNPKETLGNRIKVLNQGLHLSESDDVTNLFRQVFLRRDERFFLTDGGKLIIRESENSITVLEEFIENKRQDLILNFGLVDNQVDDILAIIRSLYAKVKGAEESDKGSPGLVEGLKNEIVSLQERNLLSPGAVVNVILTIVSRELDMDNEEKELIDKIIGDVYAENAKSLEAHIEEYHFNYGHNIERLIDFIDKIGKEVELIKSVFEDSEYKLIREILNIVLKLDKEGINDITANHQLREAM